MANTLVARSVGYALSEYTDLASIQTVSNKIFQNATITAPDITGTATASIINASTVNASTFTGDVTGQVTDISNHDTDALGEGDDNLYYTDTRARASVSASDAGGDGSLAYNDSTGVITYTGPSASEVRAHFSGSTGVSISDGAVSIGQAVGTGSTVTFSTVNASTFTGDFSGDVTGQVTDISNHDTDDLGEGDDNLYYTDTRARASVSASDAGGDGSLAYNDSTGVITYTGPSASEVRAHFSGSTGVSISDGAVSIGQAVGTGSTVTFSTVNASTFTGDFSGDVTGQVTDISNHDTDDLSEGDDNLYYTDTRAQAAFDGGTGVSISGGTVSIGQAVATDSDVQFHDVQVDGDLRTDDITATTLTASGDVVITGKLTVNGSTTYVNSTTLEIGDNVMILNKQEEGTPSLWAGIEVERGTSDNVSFLWNETDDKWTTSVSGTKYDLEVGDLEAEDVNAEDVTLSTIIFGTNGDGDNVLLQQGSINASTGDIDTTDTDSLVIKGLADGGLELDGDLTVLKSSDERLKDNVKAIEDPLEKIKMIGGYNYTWNELGEAHTMNKEGQTDVGVIAQEVEEIIPEAVTDKSNGYKAVQYEKIIPLLIECIKDQQTMIEKLQSEQ